MKTCDFLCPNIKHQIDKTPKILEMNQREALNFIIILELFMIHLLSKGEVHISL